MDHGLWVEPMVHGLMIVMLMIVMLMIVMSMIARFSCLHTRLYPRLS
jgi:hypothetical protein